MADPSQQAILLAFDRLGNEEPLPTHVVADELGAPEPMVADRLAQLGYIGHVGRKAFGWFRPSPASATSARGPPDPGPTDEPVRD